METVATSGQEDLAEELVRFFVDQGEKECFAAFLYTCYEQIKPEVVLELGWMNGLMDFAMPYMVQYIKELNGKVELLMSERKEAKTAVEAQQVGVLYGLCASCCV